jgi:hypothetical protein
LSKWKIFNWSKEKKDASIKVEIKPQYNGADMEKQKISEIKEELKETPIKMYNETLFSSGFIQKKSVTTPLEKKQYLKRASWENLVTIEHNVDLIKDKKTKLREKRIQVNCDINQKVDHVLYTKNIK